MKKANLAKIIIIVIAATTLVVALLGYLSSGFTSSDLTLSPEGAPVVDLEEMQENVGWQLHYKGATAADGFDGIRVIYSYDKEVIKRYEEQGYNVEVGTILGVGMDNTTGYRYNTADKLTVSSKSGVLVSDTERAQVHLIYSSDKKVEAQGWHDASGTTWGDETKVYSVAEYYFEDGTDPNALTYVATGFIRLTGQSGSVRIDYDPALEVLSVNPLVFGD